MNYTIESITIELKKARVAQGLSQRMLSAKSGVPQSHLSKIEQGGVDLRISSLVAIARTLGLEFVLVPQKAMPAIETIVRSSTQAETRRMNEDIQLQAKKILTDIHNLVSRLPKVNVPISEIQKFQMNVTRIPLGQFSDDDIKTLQRIHAHLIKMKTHPENIGDINRAFFEMENLRRKAAYRDDTPQEHKMLVLPAYRLE